ncbi:uncharacterized protein FOMMEDRAFT_31201 [Fomitiporia mediterranea MF3/22]|uniref:uncharacterized protein n=1 Tax=Fomitiporia mediterranea (strain MF3/22) TaxID=694068 RepID=UPI0004408556|nr:uncharacterized protein FOMMEDRAFT_31201 [Fomitiporia mediterranea MF3/22]EJC99527.1 hypothetical protein FOMMEDRAFT_31201 [Fomitiporia mediterranea MF3/22]
MFNIINCEMPDCRYVFRKFAGIGATWLRHVHPYDVLFGGKDDKKRAGWSIKAVDNYIERSKAAPLSVSISCGCDNITEDVEPNRDAVERILKKLLDHQHRWRQAYFTFSRWGTSRPPKIELLDVPILETFSIYWMSGALSHARQVYIDTSRSAKLRSLHIGGRPHIESRDGNLSSVTEVTCLDNPIYRRRRVPLLEVIQQAPNLESLKFFCDSSERDGNLQYPLTSLCKLRTLEVDNSINSAFMISKLILPILSHLICHWANSGCRVKKLPDIFRTPLPSVEYLDLVELSEVDDRLTPFIRLLPNLKSLRMIGIGITPSFFDVLSVNETPINYFQPRKSCRALPRKSSLYLE